MRVWFELGLSGSRQTLGSCPSSPPLTLTLWTFAPAAVARYTLVIVLSTTVTRYRLPFV
jgi:hypothetical protein